MEDTRQQAIRTMATNMKSETSKISIDCAMALRKASQIGQVNIVADLLTQPGINVDSQDSISNNKTALHYACESGHLDIVKLLVDHGANLENSNTSGWTPYH